MSFEDSVKELEKLYATGSYRDDRLRKFLFDFPKLRKTFATLLILKCARLGEIQQKAFATKRTIYSHLYQLIELGLVKQIAVMDLWNKKKLDSEQKKIIKKFQDWTSKMSPKQVHYFAAKTHYFLLTEIGNSPEIAAWVLKLELEFKNSSVSD